MSTVPTAPRVCLLTGAGGQLGSTACAELAAAGYRVVAVYRTRPPQVDSQLRRWIDPLDPGAPASDLTDRVHAVGADLCAEGAIERVVEVALARFGHIDLLVNGAVRYGFGSTLMNHGVLDDALTQFEVNTLLPARLALAVAQHHWRDRALENRARNRDVVNVSSVSAIERYPGQAVYAATKAALNTLTQHTAEEFAQIGVRVNALAPTSFPHLLATTSVVGGIVSLDRSTATGQILVQRAEGESWL